MVSRRVAERRYSQAVYRRRKKRGAGRIVLIVGGLALGASLAAAGTVYGPRLVSSVAPAAATMAAPPSPARLAPAPGAAAANTQGLSGPAQAIDGATLTVAGQTVHLQGVQAPPASLVCRTAALEYRCGDIARRVLDSFADGASVACLPPAPLGPGSTPTVAVCRNRRGWDLAALQVEAGWAIIRGAIDSSPYRAEQARARANGAGLWPSFAAPAQWVPAGSR